MAQWIVIAIGVFAGVAVILLGRPQSLALDYWWLALVVFLIGIVTGWASYRRTTPGEGRG